MICADRFHERFEKGDHVVLRHLLDSGDALHIDGGFLLNTSRGTARDLSGSFERRAGGQLDCEPDLVLAFQFPDGFHLGTGVAINHLFSVSRMLKTSLFSPTQPRRAETRFFPCGVLAALRGSTYRSVRLASSLAAALLDGLFEHPTGAFSPCHRPTGNRSSARQN